MTKIPKDDTHEGGVENPIPPLYKAELSELVREVADSIVKERRDFYDDDTLSATYYTAKGFYELSVKLDPKNEEAKKSLEGLKYHPD